MASGERERTVRESPHIQPRDPGTPVRASFEQERIWYLDQFEPGDPVFNIARALRLKGPLQVDALAAALDSVVQRHESLRTTFASDEGVPVQVIADQRTVRMPLSDLADVDGSLRESELQRLCAEEARRPFDLSEDLMLRACLYRMGPQEHVLLLVMHHIASDGWSLNLLNRELGLHYDAHTSGRPARPPRLPIQFADFALWQRQTSHVASLESSLDYWKRNLEGAAPVLELPTDYPRPSIRGSRGARLIVQLPGALTGALKEVSRGEGCTLFMTFLAAFATLHFRYSGQEDVVIGSPNASRNRVEVENLIGFFANMVPLRIDLTGSPRFSELLGRVRETCLDAHLHHRVPFAKLIEKIGAQGSTSYTPLFQVMLAFQNVPTSPVDFPGLTVERTRIDAGSANFDLSFFVEERSDGLEVVAEYSTDIFERETIDRLTEHYRVLLEGIAADPHRRIAELPLLTEAEQNRSLLEWNDTQEEYSRDRCIHELFDEQVARTPEAVAVEYEGSRLTFRELNQRSSVLAGHLGRLELGPDALVGICVHRSPEMVVALLAVLKAGAAYVPLDPSYPQERLRFMVEDSGLQVILTQRGLAEDLGTENVEALCLDGFDWEANTSHTGDEGARATSESLAYVIYTSGSTGQPKGVAASHRGAVNRCAWMWRAYPFEPGEVCCQKTALSFVDSVWEIFGALLQGVPLLIIPDEVVKDPQRLIRMLAGHRVTRIVLVPSLLRSLLDVEPALGEPLRRLKLWISSGETLPASLCRRFHAALPRAELLNLYGSSEVAGDVSYAETAAIEESAGSAPIGRPIANTRLYVLGAELQPMPAMVPGELYAAGDGLAQGYWRRAELTAERFVADPFSADPEARMFRTGDRARWRTDGQLEFLGRIDNQMKIRGFRVEPGEVETALMQHPRVQHVVATVWEHAADDRRLTVYVVPEAGEEATDSELRGFLRDKLPPYMVPQHIVNLDRLPMTPNGKVDRRALPSPLGLERPGDTYVEPRTDTERLVAEIWGAALGIERVGLADNFFDLGGHSLIAAQVVARIRQATGVELSLRSIVVDTLEKVALECEGGAPLPNSVTTPAAQRE